MQVADYFKLALDQNPAEVQLDYSFCLFVPFEG
jgi:hypothetical protein